MTDLGYALLDCGGGRKLERFGGVTVARPAPAAAAGRRCPDAVWQGAALSFTKETGWAGEAPADWRVRLGEAELLLRPAAGGQVGVFPEHLAVAEATAAMLRRFRPPPAGAEASAGPPNRTLRILNLFAYTGLATLCLAALPGTEIIHLDASAAAVRWARENAARSGLGDRPIRWLTDDALGFMRREARRGKRYDLILADPPAFGRGKRGEWKLERDVPELCRMAAELLEPAQSGFVLTCHREGLSPAVPAEWVGKAFPGSRGKIRVEELALPTVDGRSSLPAGIAVFLEQEPKCPTTPSAGS